MKELPTKEKIWQRKDRVVSDKFGARTGTPNFFFSRSKRKRTMFRAMPNALLQKTHNFIKARRITEKKSFQVQRKEPRNSLERLFRRHEEDLSFFHDGDCRFWTARYWNLYFKICGLHHSFSKLNEDLKNAGII